MFFKLRSIPEMFLYYMEKYSPLVWTIVSLVFFSICLQILNLRWVDSLRASLEIPSSWIRQDMFILSKTRWKRMLKSTGLVENSKRKNATQKQLRKAFMLPNGRENITILLGLHNFKIMAENMGENKIIQFNTLKNLTQFF